VCARTFRVVIFLLTPRKDGERSKGHGADCGKTLYRRLTVPNYAPEKGNGALFAVQEVWVAATTHNRRETACICRLAAA